MKSIWNNKTLSFLTVYVLFVLLIIDYLSIFRSQTVPKQTTITPGSTTKTTEQTHPSKVEQVHSTTEHPLVTKATTIQKNVTNMIETLSQNSLLNHVAIEKLKRDLGILELQIQAVKNGRTAFFKKITEKKLTEITNSIEKYLKELDEKLNPTPPTTTKS